MSTQHSSKSVESWTEGPSNKSGSNGASLYGRVLTSGHGGSNPNLPGLIMYGTGHPPRSTPRASDAAVPWPWPASKGFHKTPSGPRRESEPRAPPLTPRKGPYLNGPMPTQAQPSTGLGLSLLGLAIGSGRPESPRSSGMGSPAGPAASPKGHEVDVEATRVSVSGKSARMRARVSSSMPSRLKLGLPALWTYDGSGSADPANAVAATAQLQLQPHVPTGLDMHALPAAAAWGTEDHEEESEVVFAPLGPSAHVVEYIATDSIGLAFGRVDHESGRRRWRHDRGGGDRDRAGESGSGCHLPRLITRCFGADH